MVLSGPLALAACDAGITVVAFSASIRLGTVFYSRFLCRESEPRQYVFIVYACSRCFRWTYGLAAFFLLMTVYSHCFSLRLLILRKAVHRACFL